MAGVPPPLVGTHLLDSLSDLGTDLIPGSRIVSAEETLAADICFLIGDTPPGRATTARTFRIFGDNWSGSINDSTAEGSSGESWDSPFGAMAAATLASGEVYKLAMRRLRDATKVPVGVFDDTFAQSPRATVRLAPENTPCATGLDEVDFISGGAITDATRHPLVRGPTIQRRPRLLGP